MNEKVVYIIAAVVAIGAGFYAWKRKQAQDLQDAGTIDGIDWAQVDGIDWAQVDSIDQSQSTDSADTSGQDSGTTASDILDTIMAPVKNALGLWHAPAKYADMIAQAEARNGIPSGMLERLLYQESHYREDIISGAKRSPVGALGIAQFMPATAREMGVDPLDPAQAIDGAGRYLRRMYSMFGNWTDALAAYNWGPGNVQRKGIARAPAETVAYYSNILDDVNSANGTDYA